MVAAAGIQIYAYKETEGAYSQTATKHDTNYCTIRQL